MKMLLLALTLTLTASQAVFAQGLYYGTKSDKHKKNEFCTYSFSVPQVLPAPGSNAGTNAAAQALNAKWDAELASAKANFLTTVSDPETCQAMDSAYIVSSTFKIESRLDSVIASIVSTNSGYYGGAHGIYALSGLTFNSMTGQVYNDLGDFIEAGKIEGLKAAIWEAVHEKNSNVDKEFGWNEWSKEATSVSQIKNWYFSQDGLVVVFNPYEIASYADGAIEATVYFYKLQELGALKKSGPATLLDTGYDEP